MSTPPLPALHIERSNLGNIVVHSTTARGSERIITTSRWVIEFGSAYPPGDLQEGDWVDLLTVRNDETRTFQCIFTTTMRECRPVLKIRKLIPGEGNEALFSDRPPTPSY